MCDCCDNFSGQIEKSKDLVTIKFRCLELVVLHDETFTSLTKRIVEDFNLEWVPRLRYQDSLDYGYVHMQSDYLCDTAHRTNAARSSVLVDSNYAPFSLLNSIQYVHS